MSDQAPASPPQPELPPEARIMQMATGYIVSQATYCAAKLGIPDHLAAGPQTAAQLAAATDTNEGALYRLLRSLASVGIFSESENGKFANTPISDTMRSDAPNSTRDMVIWMCDEPHWRVYGHMLDCVKSGDPVWEAVLGEPIFSYLFQTNRDLGDIFNRAMTSFSRQSIPAILDAYDFSGADKIADVAGGYGHLLAAILAKYPDMKGVLFEIPPVLEGAPQMMESYGVEHRVQLVEGDFCESIPVAADIYLMKHIIHDWYDDKCGKILANIRRSMPDDGRVLILEMVVPGGNEPHFSKVLDLEMMMVPGGIERTHKQFESLLGANGFRLNRIIPTRSPICLVEAVKA